MKITKQLLREMIEEEMKVIQLGLGPPMPMARSGYFDRHNKIEPSEPDMGYVEDPDGYEGSMAKNNLYNLKSDAMMLCELIAEDENLEPWVQEKIAVAASMLNSVARHLKAEKTRM